MKGAAALLCLLLVGCHEPQIATDRSALVTACKGSCPKGECEDGCVPERITCDDPESCLNAYSCARHRSSRSCNAYSSQQLGEDAPVSACAQVPGEYCFTVVSPNDKIRFHAVTCTESGTTVTECTLAETCSDGGTSKPACWSCGCHKTYSIR